MKKSEFLKIILLALTTILVGPGFAMAERLGKNLKETELSSAKTLMLAGDRKQAIAVLMKIRQSVISRQEKKDIDSKIRLYGEQFYSSESFQRYAVASEDFALEHFEECVRNLEAVTEADRNNLLVHLQRSVCEMKLGKMSAAETQILLAKSVYGKREEFLYLEAELEFLKGNFTNVLTLMNDKELPRSGTEKNIVLKAKAMDQLGQTAQAIELLKGDLERNLDHLQTLFELAGLYRKGKGNLWQARKNYSLFLFRTKRMSELDQRKRGIEKNISLAQQALEEIDKLLEVK